MQRLPVGGTATIEAYGGQVDGGASRQGPVGTCCQQGGVHTAAEQHQHGGRRLQRAAGSRGRHLRAMWLLAFSGCGSWYASWLSWTATGAKWRLRWPFYSCLLVKRLAHHMRSRDSAGSQAADGV